MLVFKTYTNVIVMKLIKKFKFESATFFYKDKLRLMNHTP